MCMCVCILLYRSIYVINVCLILYIGEDVWDDFDGDDKIEDEEVADEMHNLPIPPK
jgi:hypothetical protein